MLQRLLLTFFLVISALSLWSVPLIFVSAQVSSNYCPPGYILDRYGNTCTSPDGTVILPNAPPISPTLPVNNTPNNTPPSPAPGGALPECTDNYNSAQICLPKAPFSGKLAGSSSLVQLAAEVIRILLYFAGIVAVIFVIIGGYRYMTAGGNEEGATKGRRTMTQAIIGLVIVILAYVIISAVTNYLTR